jgi:hypothetical protein
LQALGRDDAVIDLQHVERRDDVEQIDQRAEAGCRGEMPFAGLEGIGHRAIEKSRSLHRQFRSCNGRAADEGHAANAGF